MSCTCQVEKRIEGAHRWINPDCALHGFKRSPLPLLQPTTAAKVAEELRNMAGRAGVYGLAHPDYSAGWNDAIEATARKVEEMASPARVKESDG